MCMLMRSCSSNREPCCRLPNGYSCCWQLSGVAVIAGPFSLGAMSRPINTIAVLWVSFITVIFVLPTEYPVSQLTLNYAPVAVGIVLVGTLFSWILPCGLGARSWFRGELHNLPSEASVRMQAPCIGYPHPHCGPQYLLVHAPEPTIC